MGLLTLGCGLAVGELRWPVITEQSAPSSSSIRRWFLFTINHLPRRTERERRGAEANTGGSSGSVAIPSGRQPRVELPVSVRCASFLGKECSTFWGWSLVETRTWRAGTKTFSAVFVPGHKRVIEPQHHHRFT